MNEYITPGVIITILILATISSWMLVGKLWDKKIIDNMVRRDQLFRYLNSLGLVLASNGGNKTNALYYKSYMGFLATVKVNIANKLAEYNKNTIDKLGQLTSDEVNAATVDLINCVRKEYKIDKGIIKIWISDLKIKSAQQGDAPEPASPAR
jgi:hypothetical protein